MLVWFFLNNSWNDWQIYITVFHFLCISLIKIWNNSIHIFFVLLLGITKQIDCRYRSLLEIVSPKLWKYYRPPSASGNISQTSGKQFPIVTSTPVTICVMYAAKHTIYNTTYRPLRGQMKYRYLKYRKTSIRTSNLEPQLVLEIWLLLETALLLKHCQLAIPG